MVGNEMPVDTVEAPGPPPYLKAGLKEEGN